MNSNDTVNEQLGVIDMCMYCETWEDNACFTKSERKDWCSSIQIRHNKMVVRQNNREDWFKISYCPMCGKRLGDD